jgi:hypothetical protein
MNPLRVSLRFARRVVRRPTVIAPVLRRALRLHAFAGQLAARHTRAAARVSAAELLLARSTAMFVTNISRQYLLNLPRLERHVAIRTPVNGSVTQTIERVMPVGAPPSDPVAVARIGATGALLRELTLRRLVVERARREHVVAGRPAEGMSGNTDAGTPTAPLAWQPAAHAAQQLALLPLVKQKPMSLSPVPSTAAGRDVFGDRSTPARAANAAAVSERDIERLTERVIGSIDRRIVAQRERFGRP